MYEYEYERRLSLFFCALFAVPAHPAGRDPRIRPLCAWRRNGPVRAADSRPSSFASRVARTICDGSSAPAVCNRDTNGKVKQTIRESAPRSELWTAHSTTASPNTFCIGRFRSGLAAKPQKVRTKLQHCRELSSGERVHPFVKMWQLSMNAPCLNGRAGAIEGCRWCG